MDSRAALGTIQFNGTGTYVVNGTQTVNSFSALTLSLTGSYVVYDSGIMAMTNPQSTSFVLNGRAAAEAILASSTDSSTNTFDLFAAVPVPASTQSAASLSGNYIGVTFELTGGASTGVRSSLLSFATNGGGSLTAMAISGHAYAVNNGAIFTQSVNNSGNYAVQSNGLGSVNFGSSTTLLTGTKNIYVSSSGNMILGGSTTPGAQDFFLAIKSFSGTPAVTDLSGLYWTGGIRLDLGHLSTEAYAGSAKGLPTLSRMVYTDRMHQIGIAPGFDFTYENDLAANKTSMVGNFTLGLEQLLVGLGGNFFLRAGLSVSTSNNTTVDPLGFSIDIGVRAPSLSGTGVYLHPQGVVNAASLAPAGQSIAPGEYLSLFGSGLSSSTEAATPPYPTSLGNVSVAIGGIAAPIAYVSPTQLNILAPYGLTTGNNANVVVTNNGTASNAVLVAVQATAPGIFSTDSSGTGNGAITRSDGTVVSSTNPARKGESVSIYLTGLGTVTPAVADGVAASSNPLSVADNKVAVVIAGQAVTVLYAGLAPLFPGLYQVSITIPSTLAGTGSLPLAIQTVDTFHDQVNIYVQ